MSGHRDLRYAERLLVRVVVDDLEVDVDDLHDAMGTSRSLASPSWPPLLGPKGPGVQGARPVPEVREHR